MTPRVKICGVCSPEDAAAAAQAGADIIGVILAPGRARSRTPEQAAGIRAVAPGVAHAGVWMDAGETEVCDVARRLRLDVIQLHGDETPGMLRTLRAAGDWALWKAVSVRYPDDVLRAADLYANVADALLLDGWSADGRGGTGTRFAWDDVLPALEALPPTLQLVVAGGLDEHNVADAIRTLRPDVVDVSSGVESAPGRKSVERMMNFVAAVRGVESR